MDSKDRPPETEDLFNIIHLFPSGLTPSAAYLKILKTHLTPRNTVGPGISPGQPFSRVVDFHHRSGFTPASKIVVYAIITGKPAQILYIHAGVMSIPSPLRIVNILQFSDSALLTTRFPCANIISAVENERH
jgi:hypothetical protein